MRTKKKNVNQLENLYIDFTDNELIIRLENLRLEKYKEPSILHEHYDKQIFYIKRELVKRNLDF